MSAITIQQQQQEQQRPCIALRWPAARQAKQALPELAEKWSTPQEQTAAMNTSTLFANLRSLNLAFKSKIRSPPCRLDQDLQPNKLKDNSLAEGVLKTETPQHWLQLSGHEDSFQPSLNGIIRKRIKSLTDREVLAYGALSQEPKTANIVPKFFGIVGDSNGEKFIQLSDLLNGFTDPCAMDIKLGSRTFLETEVHNQTPRADLYKKMLAIDAAAPTAAEHKQRAVTKLRYMRFRESMSSTQALGFRIEALRLAGCAPIKDLKTCQSDERILATLRLFLNARPEVRSTLIERLKKIRQTIEESPYFQSHEVIGSSLFIVYDAHKAGAWLIDFAKTEPLPLGLTVSHRANWTLGNHEEGLLKGLDNLIKCFESVEECA